VHTYVAKYGDSLESVAAKFDVGYELLTAINGIDESTGLTVGQRLEIPVRILRRRMRYGESRESIANSLQIPTEHVISREDGGLIAVF